MSCPKPPVFSGPLNATASAPYYMITCRRSPADSAEASTKPLLVEITGERDNVISSEYTGAALPAWSEYRPDCTVTPQERRQSAAADHRRRSETVRNGAPPEDDVQGSEQAHQS